MAGNFEKFSSPGKGNGLRATREFAVGELVTCAEPFVYTTCRSRGASVCDHCLRRRENLRRCSQCKFGRYCNTVCQKAAWKDHRRECLCLKSISPNVPTDSVRLVARIIFKLLEQPDCTSGELYPVTDLQSHFKDLNEDMKQGLGHLAATLQQYLKREIPDSSKLPPGFQTLDYFSKLTCNSFTISDGEMQDVGVGLYPSMSLLNHCCDPNCVIVFEGTRLHLRTVREIPQREELTISYIDVKMTSPMRQMQCQRQYCFTCDCNRCVSKDKDEDMLAGGEEASRELEHSLVRLEELRSHNNFTEALDLCKKLMSRSLLPNKNIHQLKALDFAMDLCITLERWEEALQYALQTLEPYSLYYSNHHPVRAVQIMKVGKLQLHLGMFPEAMTTLRQAFDIMKVTHGRDHALTHDLMDLLRECEMGVKAT
ncbi:histone-lysine N-methyltransferase SMYD3 isoform X2 [Dendropsophus ebraccatus]|uniref:histone-lysine N-methyltransferase SMYD3 isoform X2 n=1 Tax=Dendropsophus ebraccatus TaxID=150705 RepID=UPI003831B9DB